MCYNKQNHSSRMISSSSHWLHEYTQYTGGPWYVEWKQIITLQLRLF